MSSPDLPGAEAPRFPNLPVFTVAEISAAIKRTVEEGFSRVRVSGEVSGLRRPGSGHLYMDLKDADALIAAVCWRGVAAKLAVMPEDGLEIIVTGRVTTYGPQSKYQIVIEDVELAGEGALLKLIEERRKKLAAEGLFDEARKKPLPFLPDVIGVVTSPTGAVIRDILHRLEDRFPRHVVIWPALVQGKGAAEAIAAGIEGLNALEAGGRIARPDVIIVARGGGSLEDLMAFNEEIVVCAAAASEIPLISAVGHETDITLIDFAADVRAPTPTAAAEMAVPVRLELATQVAEENRRLSAAMVRMVDEARRHLGQLWRIAGDPRRLMEEATQRLDDRTERLRGGLAAVISEARGRFAAAAGGLRPGSLTLGLSHGEERVASLAGRLDREAKRAVADRETTLRRLAGLLASTSYGSVLARGFAVIRDENERAVMAAAAAKPGMGVRIEFGDGEVPARIEGPTPAERPARARGRGSGDGGGDQGSLL